MSFSLANLDLRYEPFPIGVARPIMGEAAYQRYLDRYPPIELFEYIPKVGNKYCLSEKYNPGELSRMDQGQRVLARVSPLGEIT